MALKAVVASLAGLAPEVAKEYKPGEGALEGKFILDVETVDGHGMEDIAGLKNALSTEKNNLRELKRSKKQLEEEFETTKAALEEKAGTASETVKKQIESQIKQLTEKHAKDLAEKDSAIKERDSNIDDLLITSQATAAINEMKGNAVLLLPHVRAMTKVIRENGKPRAVIVGPDGNPKMSMKQGNTGDMSISEFVESMKKDTNFAVAFAGSGASGGAGNQKKDDNRGRGTTEAEAQGTGGLSAVQRLSGLRREQGAAATVKNPT